VSAITISIRITDCAAEPPRSSPSTPPLVHLVNQDLGGARRPARGHGVDDREGLEEGVDQVDHERKKVVGEVSGKMMVQKALGRTAPSR
jgi:hypothetical protein